MLVSLSLLFQDVFHMVVEVPRWSNAKMEVRELVRLGMSVIFIRFFLVNVWV